MTDDTNVITFRPRAGDPPTPPPLPPLPEAAAPPPLPPSPSSAPAPDTTPDAGAGAVPGRVRQSAAGSLADVLAGPAPLPPLPPQPTGDAPATFRSEGLDDGPGQQGPGLGALSLSAVLAVALAALRGTVTVVSDWRQRRMERAAEEAAWREAKVKRHAAEEDARARLAKVPTSAEFGRKAVQDGRKAAAGPSGSGKSGKGGSTAQGSTGGPTRKPGPVSPSKPPASTKGPDKPRGGPTKPKPPDKTKDGKGPGPSGKTGKPGSGKTSPPEKTGKPSSGVLAPGKGKSPGGPGKGLLKRTRDRKADGGVLSPRGDKARPKKSGGGPDGGKGLDRAKRGARADQDKRGGKTRPDQKSGGPGHSPRRPWHGRKGRPRPGSGPAAAPGKRATPPRTGAPPKPPGGAPGAGRVPPRPKTPPRGAAGGPPPGGWAPPPRGARRSADEDLHNATAYTETVITVERADRPGDQARRWEPTPAGAVTTGARSLPRSPVQPAGPRPGTTTSTTKEATVGAPAPRIHMPAARTGGAAAEHLTEVTLDDVLDHLAASKARCFATYDQCAALAEQARKLRRSFEDLAEELTQRHNVIGRLTSRAMTRLAELMDVVARKAEQMRTESLNAAEAVETAHDAMHDAYRPVQQATADAGLDMPSARIHNED
ncbi:hypothetical protein [Streptomyces sp. NBC_01689]|uniref:hypothetical protein n=1 Tax=Streptomyces sp. NBC_01689 TaxID=2975911 RepID=UPI002E3457B1|nr:hypothetical protein [Streptomyces sp. NBC_01689]